MSCATSVCNVADPQVVLTLMRRFAHHAQNPLYHKTNGRLAGSWHRPDKHSAGDVSFQNLSLCALDVGRADEPRIPGNLRFRVPRDYESPSWALGEDSFDLVHIRQACGSVSSWPELYQKVFRCVTQTKGGIYNCWVMSLTSSKAPQTRRGTYGTRRNRPAAAM